MTAEWREFEKLIARIKCAISPLGATVTSPDWLVDKDTGEQREVDASIRYQQGEHPMLITVECRDRTAIEDVRWIEQLAQKQISIGATKTIAVTSSRFTQPAIKKAAALGIEVRTLADANASDFSEWLGFQTVEQTVNEWELVDLELELYDVTEGVSLSRAMQDAYRQLGSRAPIFVQKIDGMRFHVEHVLTEWKKQNGDFFPSDLPEDGSVHKLTIHWPFGRGLLEAETTHGRLEIRVMHIGLALSRTATRVPMATASLYADPKLPLVQVAEWRMDSNIVLSLHRDLHSDKTKLSVTKNEQTSLGKKKKKDR